MRNMPRAIVLGLALVLSILTWGCSIAKRHVAQLIPGGGSNNVEVAGAPQEKPVSAPAEPEPQAGVITLTLDTVVAHALTNNPELKAVELDREMADRNAFGKSRYWEPDLVVSVEHEDSRRENTVEESLSMFTPIFEEEDTAYSVSLEGTLLRGGRYRLGYTLEDLANNLTNLTFSEQEAF